ncbi:MAG: ABC transporter permease [Muribaculaceae bacterium]|nr:ABC transporter permease [Muribaculaceae bacterium]
MSKLSLIVSHEVLTDVKSKSFWIGTIVVPVVVILIGGVFGLLMSEADTFNKTMQDMSTSPDPEEMTAAKAVGMLMGMFLTFFLMIYGGMIFNKVKTEKTNRIMEILLTSVDGRTMMLAKVLSVGIIGLVQLLVWSSLILLGVGIFFMVFQSEIPWDILSNPKLYISFCWMLLYFIGGYVLFGSLYAACGAIVDKDGENQTYMTVITFILLATFYLGQYAVDNGDSTLAVVCNFIPFTSPSVGTINAVSGVSPVWQTILSLVILYASAAFCIVFAGKLYRSSLLFKGKKFTPKDIITFIKTK